MRPIIAKSAKLPVEEVLEIVHFHSKPSKPKDVTIGYIKVRVVNPRLKTFLYKGTRCAICGLEGKYFSLEKNTDYWALNLYGIDTSGHEIPLTRDHILARCLGGKDNLENTQTLCYRCNQQKGKAENREKHKSRNFLGSASSGL